MRTRRVIARNVVTWSAGPAAVDLAEIDRRRRESLVVIRFADQTRHGDDVTDAQRSAATAAGRPMQAVFTHHLHAAATH
jgi:hypothetical protein